MEITPVHPHFGARVEGSDLTRPLDDATFARIRAAFDEHSVLVFPDQRLTDEQQLAFSLRFGPLETTIRSVARTDRYHPNVVDLTNLDRDDGDRLMGWDARKMVYQAGNQLWHTDSSFKPVPALASLLSAREVPPAGGETEFASLRHAWATLPEATQRRLAGRVAVHSILYSRSTIAPGLFDPEHERELPPVRQALVRENPVNGRRALYLGSHAWYVEGMEHAESRRLLDELLAHTTSKDRLPAPGDRSWDAARHRRVMRRTTVAGAAPTADPPHATRTAVWEGIIPAGVGVG